MKTVSIILFASLLAFSNAAAGFFVVSTDSQINTGSFTGSGGAATLTVTATATTAGVPVTATTYTGGFAAGIPLTASYQLNNDAATANIILVVLRVGPQVSLTVTYGTQTTGTGTALPTTTTAGIAGTPSVTAACGTYAIDCAAGTLSFTLNTAAFSTGNVQICAVTVTQVAAISGILSWVTASAPASPYTAVISAINTANSATSPSTTICGTSTTSTTTLLYFISTYGSTTATADQTSAYTKVRASAQTQGIASNTQYYVANLQPSSAAGVVAPSSAATSNLATASKSESKLMVFAGLTTTIVAGFFGFAL